MWAVPGLFSPTESMIAVNTHALRIIFLICMGAPCDLPFHIADHRIWARDPRDCLILLRKLIFGSIQGSVLLLSMILGGVLVLELRQIVLSIFVLSQRVTVAL